MQKTRYTKGPHKHDGIKEKIQAENNEPLDENTQIEGRNAVIEAYRAGKPIDKLFILDGCQDGPMMTIKREAKKHDTLVKYVTKERLDQLSETGKHQGVIAYAAAYEYAEVDDILEGARKKGEPPFIFLLDNIEDPHNLGAIIRTANLAGAHGVIIPKNRAAGLTATVARTSAGALNYTPVAKVTNLAKTIEELWKVAPDLQVVVCTAYSDYSWDDLLFRLHAHDEQGCQEGDVVRVSECRPLSKTKNWRVVEIVTRAAQ